jgi:glycerophosphoryl diester phosphodiesterase
MSLGMNLLELDVHLTKDGEVVVFHDNDLKRSCGVAYKDQRISDYNYADLPAY